MEKDDILKRLKKIEGQVRGVHKMVEEDRYCVDILIQLAAIRSATNRVGIALLERHTQGCVRGAIQSGDGDKAIEELMEVVRSFVK
ncbi:metal-sensitive transcriptional regulator [Microaerobacter geothermalis]|uniref:metal-sensitive transcriptional regulator n=1 Tax=Microaerobacter geothermalis TaxID=674972 RepID=UPI002E35B7A4|nr:metal-sensitive transcriptional regulator [Microaerobacter geothermalis]